MSEAADVVTAARTYKDVRWRHQGRSREGIDCVGLVVLVRRDVFGCGFDKTDYPRIASDESLRETCERMLVRVPEPAPGDVVVMRWDDQRHIAIVGDYVYGGLSLIHAYLPARKVVETRLADSLRSRVMGAYRHPELMGNG